MKNSILSLIFLLAALCGVTAAAVTTTYQFLPDPNALRTSGGIHGQGCGTFSIEGQFQLTVDLDGGIASFDQVDATLSEEIPYYDYDEGDVSFTQSLCVLFSMTELESTYVSDTTIDFVLERNIPTFPGADVYLTLTFIDDMVNLTGYFGMPLADGYWYSLDTVAVELPNTFYVDAVNGDDNNDGLSPNTAFATIQKGIDMAEHGDTVIVYPGLYPEIINFLGKNITLKSTDPASSNIVKSTTIAGIVVFRGTEGPDCTLTGFNIDGYVNGFDWEIDPSGSNHTHATISHCVFENFMTGCGQLIYACDGTISNCTVANIGYMCLRPSPVPAIVGCHGLIKNSTMVNMLDGIEVLEGGTCTITNCIIYHNAWAVVHAGATLNISYCNFEGGRDRIWGNGTVNWGPGNIDTDPCFARLVDWQTEGDYHLKSQAGRWDPDNQTWMQDNLTSPCIDAGDPMSPIGLEPFPNGGIINMGAYGGTTEASKSYFGQTVCETIVAGDINGDCKVNFLDFRLMALHWLRDENQ